MVEGKYKLYWFIVCLICLFSKRYICINVAFISSAIFNIFNIYVYIVFDREKVLAIILRTQKSLIVLLCFVMYNLNIHTTSCLFIKGYILNL